LKNRDQIFFVRFISHQIEVYIGHRLGCLLSPQFPFSAGASTPPTKTEPEHTDITRNTTKKLSVCSYFPSVSVVFFCSYSHLQGKKAGACCAIAACPRNAEHDGDHNYQLAIQSARDQKHAHVTDADPPPIRTRRIRFRSVLWAIL
jgi:hypothetical protein